MKDRKSFWAWTEEQMETVEHIMLMLDIHTTGDATKDLNQIEDEVRELLKEAIEQWRRVERRMINTPTQGDRR